MIPAYVRLVAYGSFSAACWASFVSGQWRVGLTRSLDGQVFEIQAHIDEPDIFEPLNDAFPQGRVKKPVELLGGDPNSNHFSMQGELALGKPKLPE